MSEAGFGIKCEEKKRPLFLSLRSSTLLNFSCVSPIRSNQIFVAQPMADHHSYNPGA